MKTCTPNTVKSTISSAFVLDIRESTKYIRDARDTARLDAHIQFMTTIYEKVYVYCLGDKIGNPGFRQWAFNDTGDGCICVFWGNKHSLRCLRVVSLLYLFLSKSSYLRSIGLSFGIGVHSAKCSIESISTSQYNDNFIFGIVANSAARVESFNKVFAKGQESGQLCKNILITGKAKKLVVRSDPFTKNHFERISNLRFDILDAKPQGHLLYTMKKDGPQYFAQLKL